MRVVETWRCRDGRVLAIKDMDTDHLQNTVRMLRRTGFYTPEEYLGLLAYTCSSSTPDGACMAAENELAGARVNDKLAALEYELQRRRATCK